MLKIGKTFSFSPEFRGLLAHVELDVIGTEISGVNGVICLTEVEIDGDLEAFFGDDFLEFVEGSSAGHAILNGNRTVIKNVDEFFPDLRAGVADGVHNPAPIGVSTEPRALCQCGICDGLGGSSGVIEGGGTIDLDFDKFCDAFAVFDNHPREIFSEMIEGALEGFSVGCAVPNGLVSSGSVGEHDHRVVGAHIAIDGDAIKGLFDGYAEGLLEFCLLDLGIGGDEAEHRCHIGINHSGALGDSPDAHDFSTEGELHRYFFWKSVAGHDGFSGLPASSGGECLGKRGDGGLDFFDGHLDADSARRADEDLSWLNAESGGGGGGHPFGGLDADETGAGVGVSRVGNDRPDIFIAEVNDGNANWGGLDSVGCKSGGGNGFCWRINEGDIWAIWITGFDSSVGTSGDESLWGGHSSCDFGVRHRMFLKVD